MSDQENGSRSPSARQALATLFYVAAGEVRDSETPPAFAHAIAGSIRHRGNKVERCDVGELREIAAALRAFAEIIVVCDAHMARGLQSVAACVDAQVDVEVQAAPLGRFAAARAALGDVGEALDRVWYECGACQKQVLLSGPPSGGTAMCWHCVRARSLSSKGGK